MNLVSLKIVGIITLLLSFLFAISFLGKRYAWPPEWKRKVLHVGFGLTGISFPWLFTEFWQVLVVCSTASLILLLIRNVPWLKNNIGKSIHDVKRSSFGELLFALSILLLFWLSHGDYVLFVIPLAILTISDTMSALVGTHYGKHLFAVVGGIKSWEGTLTFVGVTFAILVIFLKMLTPLSWAAVLMIAMTFSMLGAIIEAISWHGLDNLFLPIAAYLFLSTVLQHDDSQLFYQLSVLTGIVLFGLLASQISHLNTHALMTATIVLYFFWVIGGVVWLVAPILVFLCHVAFIKIQHDEGNYTANAILSVSSGGFFWLVVDRLLHIPFGFFLFALAFAIHLQAIILLRLKACRGKKAEPSVILLTSVSASSVLLTTFVYYGVDPTILTLFVFSIIVMFLGGLVVCIQADRFSSKRWATEALLALSGSATALIPIWIMGNP